MRVRISSFTPDYLRRRIGRWIEILMISSLAMKKSLVVISKKNLRKFLPFFYIRHWCNGSIAVSKTVDKSSNLLCLAVISTTTSSRYHWFRQKVVASLFNLILRRLQQIYFQNSQKVKTFLLKRNNIGSNPISGHSM